MKPFDKLTPKKRLLDAARPLPVAMVHNLDEWFRVELTYASNAIEGNTLTLRETAVILERGITIGGKSIVEHLEATNHAKALDLVRELAAGIPENIGVPQILDIHNIILRGIDDANAGHFRNVPVRIAGARVILPNPVKVPDLMEEFGNWLHKNAAILHPVELAAEAHYQLVTIHPFVDGNGRTARLLMNLILLMAGYPIAIIRKRDRLDYLTALEKAQVGGSKADFYKIVSQAVDRSLKLWLKAIGDSEPEDNGFNIVAEEISGEPELMKIGKLAKALGKPTSTIRYWTKLGLLEVAEVTSSGYQLYAPEMVYRGELVLNLQKNKRLTLEEIVKRLESPNYL